MYRYWMTILRFGSYPNFDFALDFLSFALEDCDSLGVSFIPHKHLSKE